MKLSLMRNPAVMVVRREDLRKKSWEEPDLKDILVFIWWYGCFHRGDQTNAAQNKNGGLHKKPSVNWMAYESQNIYKVYKADLSLISMLLALIQSSPQFTYYSFVLFLSILNAFLSGLKKLLFLNVTKALRQTNPITWAKAGIKKLVRGNTTTFS